MRIHGLGVILVVASLTALAPSVSAGENPFSPQPECRTGSVCPDSKQDSVAPPPLVVGPVAAPKSEKPDLMAEVGAFFQDVGAAASSAAAAVGSAAVAVGAALVGALRSYAEILLGLKPSGMDHQMFVSLATASTAVAAFGLQAGSWWGLRRLLPYFSLMPGFSRIAKDELLDNESRARMYEMIQQNPGIRLGDLTRGLEIPWGTTIHHLRKLRADRLITFQIVGHHKCFFVNGSGLNQKEMSAASVVQGKTVEGIAAFIEQHPQTTLKELAFGLGISSPLAAFHVAKLEKAGLVQKVRDGRSIRIVPAARLCPPALTATVAIHGRAMPAAA